MGVSERERGVLSKIEPLPALRESMFKRWGQFLRLKLLLYTIGRFNIILTRSKLVVDTPQSDI